MTEKKVNSKNKTGKINKPEKLTMPIKIFGALIGVIALVLVFASFQSNDYHIERAIIITAPASAIFENVNDFHHWQSWAPWEKLDPAVKRTFEGPEAGTGSVYHWSGNDKVGEGSMTITESHPKEMVQFKMDLLKPSLETSTAEITFKESGKQTLVTWVKTGHINYTAKLFNLFNDMDKAVGDDLQNGLEKLKWATQGAPKP